MKINQVEQTVGISKKNIRFYETEGLLKPGRDIQNGYREYSDADVERLKRIKLFRKLGIPISEILLMLDGELTVSDAMARHRISLERQCRNLEQAKYFCDILSQADISIDKLDAGAYLERTSQLEREGTTFMDGQKQDIRSKLMAPIVCTCIISTLMISIIAILLWAVLTNPADAPPLPIIALIAICPAAVVAGVIAALWSRYKEIKGGEEDAAGKY